MPLAAERDTVTSLVPSLSPTLAVAEDRDTVGASSSSVIVTTVLVAVPSTAFVGEEPRVTVNVSSGSSLVSEVTVTVIVPLVSPASIVRFPLETDV